MNYKPNWTNPYANKGKFRIKGNLHTHTDLSGCGSIPFDEVLKKYEKMGYGYLAITDHGIISDPNPKKLKTNLLLLAGLEADFGGSRHTCITALSAKSIKYKKGMSQQRMINENNDNCLVVLNHPDWQETEHYPATLLYKLKNYRGMEIYNTVIERLTGSALSTAKWDRLLGRNIRVLGFANQDSHKHCDYIDCCNVVNVKKKTKEEVFKALMTGNFYCHYGVEITDTGRAGNKVYIKTANAGEIRFVGNSGVILKKVRSRAAEMSFDDSDSTKYIRIECYGKGGEVSWTQPFFRTSGDFGLG